MHEIERAVIESPPGVIRFEDLSASVQAAAGRVVPAVRGDRGLDSYVERRRRLVEAWERQELRSGLQRCQGNRSQLARELRISRQKLTKRLRKLGILT